MKIILWIIIIAAVIAVCIKKIRDFKAGRFCDCGCQNCPSKCKSPKKFEE